MVGPVVEELEDGPGCLVVDYEGAGHGAGLGVAFTKHGGPPFGSKSDIPCFPFIRDHDSFRTFGTKRVLNIVYPLLEIEIASYSII